MLMLTKCTKCGKFFGSDNGSDVCDSCKISTGQFSEVSNLDEVLFQTTREFVYDNPNVSPEDVIDYVAEKGLTITRKTIMDYVRNGLIILVSMEGKSTCEECGRTILSGRFCPSCTRKKEKDMGVQKSADDPSDSSSNLAGMRAKK